MKNIKLLSALILIAAMVFIFAACAAKSPAWSTPADVTGTTFEAGKFTVLVPDGWSGVAVSDTFNDYDTAYNPYQAYIAKGKNINSETGVYSKPYILVEFTPADETFYELSSMFYDNVEEKSITVNGQEWIGFSGHFISDCIILWTEYADGSHAEVTIYHEGDKITVDDVDVQAILMSIRY